MSFDVKVRRAAELDVAAAQLWYETTVSVWAKPNRQVMKEKYPRGHFQKLIREGKLKIEFASTKEISAYEEIATNFLEKIFDMDRRSCLISDESSLWDFRAEQSKEEVLRRIQESYGIDVGDVKDGNLITIFKRIDWQRKPAC